MRLLYSPEAVADLARLRAFIAEHDPAATGRIAAELVSRIDRLCAFPAMGHGVPEAPTGDAVRDFAFGHHYVVRYSVHDAALVVLRIWHHREERATPD
ncbi:MAG: type II toxin-antitoxin system RelE/ParE family toxin [Rhodanobacter sp.]|nr:MAG: type II toxin-antitoxin system RelE/ParE family toxin [Rhodanobacter sp.]TAL96006.1 MAG: type II toxin-antitoxin system RelE/ParE family toxin [Rhodanobacter sp.]TAM40733.1 MAG: type II toxin-antitoxin system RelE/ParE family toxin [Rhodanobacter sp.]